MNLYFVHAHNLHYTEVIDRELGGPSYDDGGFGEYVYAETPGKAKSMVFKQERRNWSHLEWTDLHISIVHSNVGSKPGIASVYTDRLAAQACGMPEEYWPEATS